MIDIFKDVESILNSVDGLLIIDIDEKIVFMCEGLMDTIGVDSFDKIKGKRLRDIIASNNTYKVLETGHRQIGVTYLVHGYTIVANGYPIYKNGELIGALEYDVFEDIDLLEEFFEKMSSQKDLYHFGDSLNRKKRAKYSLDNIKGSSNVVKKIKGDIKFAGRSNSAVLITGETGSGKELIAHAIHMAGQRSLFKFITVDCASIPTELFESEIFGYEEGSFTGAKKGGKPGRAELADKGTLFLDEINALPLHMQAKLLRFLQEKEIQRVGGEKLIPVDVRVIAATNKDLQKLIKAGEFREDLYYRLNVFEIIAEPLRKRRSDIPELSNYFMEQINHSLGRNSEVNRVKSIDNEALKMLIDYDWPGNIRELRNVIERAINKCSEHTLTLKHFDDFMIKRTIAENDDSPNHEIKNLKNLKQIVEIHTIQEVLSQPHITYQKAADILGISRQMLYKKIKQYKIEIAVDFTKSQQ